MSSKFQFWYDFASPYSFLSAMRIDGLSTAAGVRVEWRPFLLGPIFKSSGWDTSPFNIYEAKGRYMWRDVGRRSAKYGVSFRRPSEFPRNGVLASRIAIAFESNERRALYSKLVFSANFTEDRDISDESVLASLLESLGEGPGRIVSAALSQYNRGRLRLATEEAAGKGIFGAPSFLAGEELFWGDDRLEDALEWFMRSVESADGR
ncbi:MAG TPA: 2-hydroxychromene-2-carboxylate isomerase [Thermodesulfobacteriota bacterium]|nr:2-hydroxychromene-2-carboxylate isomerase [Thermodesulfobacteriota bacterium]